MPWPSSPSIDALQLKRENDQLGTTVVCLRAELRNKERHIHRLELLLHQRTETIDQLTAQVEQLRLKNKQLTAERAQAQSQPK
jgi:hypothetical protein